MKIIGFYPKRSSLNLLNFGYYPQYTKDSKFQPEIKLQTKLSTDLIRNVKENYKEKLQQKIFSSKYLTLLSFLSENISNKCFLKDFLFNKEMPKSFDWKCRRIPRPMKNNERIT
jgi:hypothetical protein